MELIGKTLLVVLLLGCQMQQMAPNTKTVRSQGAENAGLESEWLRILSCGLTKTESCQQDLQSARDSPNLEIAGLANVLLDEWTLTEASGELSTPRAVRNYAPDWKTLYKESEESVDWFLFLATVEVSPEGMVKNVTILRDSGDRSLDAELVEGLQGLKFRPAIRDGEYALGEIQISISPDFS